MKRCPVCNRTYDDASLNFCLEDGAPLVANAQSFQSQNIGTLGLGSNSSLTQTKKSGAGTYLLWTFAGLALLGVAGFFGLLILIGMASDTSNKKPAEPEPTSNNKNSGSKKSGIKNANVDITRWTAFKSTGGEAKIVGDEYHLRAETAGYFYIMIASTTFEDRYLTNNSTVRVTARSVSGDVSPLGYGLVINSDTDPIDRDYAFLIRNGNIPSYRIARHTNDKETTVKDWTPATQIRTGAQPNQLEVRSKGKTLSFYINNQFVTSIQDESGEDKGIVGVYTSDTDFTAFSDLEIEKN